VKNEDAPDGAEVQHDTRTAKQANFSNV